VKQPGAEPLSGYKLIQLLGRGGFGEVWKCEAPGGIAKAIKFVKGNIHVTHGEGVQAAQEYKALKRVVSIRHPFILSMDRIEEMGGELLIVMELADQTLFDLFESCRRAGYAGIPRDELLGYMSEAAEALDLMNSEHGLQHLDIKPGNLFLVANHVKVADFGLVSDLGTLQAAAAEGGDLGNMTPLYVSPEALQGQISPFSDQYSLAIVYQELLTGTLPFNGRSARQLAMQHMIAEPNLEAVPPRDAPIVAKALSKEPDKRFPSCLAFVHALLTGEINVGVVSSNVRTSRILHRVPSLETKGEINLDAVGETRFAGRETTSVNDVSADTGAPLVQPVPPPVRPQPATRPADRLRTTAPLPPVPPVPSAALGLTAEEHLLPGYQFLDCIGRNPLGEHWKVKAPDKRLRMVKMVTGFEGQDQVAEARAVNLLKSLKHAGLVRYDMVHTGPGQLALVSDIVEESLWDRFQAHRAQRMPGIARTELLGLLHEAAETLDDLFERFEFLHLSLTPRSLMLPENDALLVAEFGLVQLLWMPNGQGLAQFNARYGAPELADNMIARSSDVYSLALIYQEMLTGIHPMKKSMSGGRGRAVARAGQPDLDLLPADDRPIVARALHPSPDHRFQTCMEFVEALELVDAPADDPRRARIAPSSSAELGTATWFDLPLDTQGPPPAQVVNELVQAVAAPWPIEVAAGMRYFHRQGEVIVHRCGAMLHSGLAQAKLEGFRQAVGAQSVPGQEENVFTYRIFRPRSFWQACRGVQPGLEVSVRMGKPVNKAAMLTEVVAQINPFELTRDEAAILLKEAGPKVLENLRTYLQATPERRAAERYEYCLPLKVAPVYPRGEVGTPITCQGKDLSLGGIGFYTSLELPTAQVCVFLTLPPGPKEIPVPALVVRSQPCHEPGWQEVGVKFLLDAPAAGPQPEAPAVPIATPANVMFGGSGYYGTAR
jgi:serine/threonine protein kinase